MKLFYIDESGTSLGDMASPFFILAAAGIDSTQAQMVDREISSLKRRLMPYLRAEDWEIKGRDMRRGEPPYNQQSWPQRLEAMRAVATVAANLPCQHIVIIVDKRILPEGIDTHERMYTMALRRLLIELEKECNNAKDQGLLMVDSRSTLRSHADDRRLLDAYRGWVSDQGGTPSFVEAPWFGVSAYYSGLQLADFVAYLADFEWHERERQRQRQPRESNPRNEMRDLFRLLRSKARMVVIP